MAKKPEVKTGDDVTWKWGKGTAEGKVTKVLTKDTTETLKGAKVKRKASAETPAVELKTPKGAKVLKSTTEIKKKK